MNDAVNVSPGINILLPKGPEEVSVTTTLLGGTVPPVVVKEEPATTCVSEEVDVIVRVGVYVVAAESPVIEREVAVDPVYGVEGAPGIAKEYEFWLNEDHETVALLDVTELAVGPLDILGRVNDSEAAVPFPAAVTALT